MIETILKKIINLPISIHNEIEWGIDDFEELDEEIKFINDNFHDELEVNLLGQNHLIKNDIIRHYTVSISHIINNVFVDYSEVESSFFKDEVIFPNIEALKKIQECYINTIDIICFICINNSIDLNKIVNENHITNGVFITETFNDYIRKSSLEKDKLETNFKNFFINDGFVFYTYLNENFDKKYKEHNKYSCIYRLMCEDKFIEDLRPEQFKRYVNRSLNEKEIKFSLKQRYDLSESIKKHYYELKTKYK